MGLVTNDKNVNFIKYMPNPPPNQDNSHNRSKIFRKIGQGVPVMVCVVCIHIYVAYHTRWLKKPDSSTAIRRVVVYDYENLLMERKRHPRRA